MSGLAAGAGINLLTSISGTPEPAKWPIVADSTVWVVAAAFMAYAAHLSETADRAAALVIDNTLTQGEKSALIRDEESHVRRPYRISLALSAVFLILAVLLIPGLGIQG